MRARTNHEGRGNENDRISPRDLRDGARNLYFALYRKEPPPDARPGKTLPILSQRALFVVYCFALCVLRIALLYALLNATCKNVCMHVPRQSTTSEHIGDNSPQSHRAFTAK